MTFEDICKNLGIEEYAERIFKSNSHGELMHLQDYYFYNKKVESGELDKILFKTLFKVAVDYAEKYWVRPESVFQHMPEMINSIIKRIKKKK